MAENVTSIGGFSQAGAEKLREMAGNNELFTEYLKFHGRMFKHTPSVTLEFFVQHPESRFVATQSQWEKVGNPVIPESEGIRFRDSKGGVVELYDITQCENQQEPYQWRMTPDGETVVRQELGLPDDRSLLNGLVQRVREPEMIIETMKRLGFPPRERSAFEMQFNLAVGAILAGRLEIGGSAFTVPVDASVLSRMNDMQRLGFITMAAVT